MKTLRLTCCRVGRVLLISALLSSALVRSAVGEALVVHQHGARRTHLHVVGWGDVLPRAALSSNFGHCSRFGHVLRSASPDVRVIAIVTTGAVFVSAPSSDDNEDAALASIPHGTPVSATGAKAALAVEFATFVGQVRLGRTASAVLLLRNHALLL